LLLVAPVIKEKRNITVTEGTPLDMVCVVRGDYFPEVTWRRAGIQQHITENNPDNDSIFVSTVFYLVCCGILFHVFHLIHTRAIGSNTNLRCISV